MSGSEIGRSCGRSTFRGSRERDGDGERSRIHRKWSHSPSRTAGLAAQPMSFGACLGAPPTLGIAAAKNELRRRWRAIARNPKPAKCQNIKTFQRVRQKELKKISVDMKAIFLLGIARVRQLQITGSKFGLIAS